MQARISVLKKYDRPLVSFAGISGGNIERKEQVFSISRSGGTQGSGRHRNVSYERVLSQRALDRAHQEFSYSRSAGSLSPGPGCQCLMVNDGRTRNVPP